ncbi:MULTISPECIES: DUF6894 family protein [Bradyrhizobium]|uniref:DUF6894 domain-containing protein n=1 Tax=Bradyrhizobium septentrionale TaxID=1404411 RepID=A0ABZ2NUJ7_9BRAD|nr:hypothetical protein [Bradyrhizobium sp. 6(2017)]QIG98148.1 hypothetical protein G6P99_42085 [Bradyrhizobium sp. 6(2017)]
MTRYYFDLREDGVLAPDEEGLEFDSLEAVKEEASRSLLDLVRDQVLERGFRDAAVEVRDGADRVLKVAVLWTMKRLDS